MPPKTSAFKPPSRATANTIASISKANPKTSHLLSSSSSEDSANEPQPTTAKSNRPPATTKAANQSNILASSTSPPSSQASSELSDSDADPDAEPLPTSDPSIPEPLLTHLLYTQFSDPNTRISKTAMSGLQAYIETFAREAVARADEERVRSEEGKVLDIGEGGFLDVEDLEKLAPQLLLDF